MKITTIPSGALYVNTYLVTDEDTNVGFIVDPGGYDPKLTEKIKEDGVDIKYIILTHGHSDHIGGVKGYVSDFPKAKVVAHEDEREMLENANYNMSTAFGTPCVVQADVFAADGDELEAGNLSLKLIHTPGHSPGGMCIYIESENVLFSGDTLFLQSVGRTDFPGCSTQALIDSIKNKLFTLPNKTTVFSGHTPPTEIGYEKKNNPFVS